MSELMEQKYRAIREAAMPEGRAEGYAEGLAEGRAEGFAAGMDQLSSLVQVLIAENKTSELQKAFTDSEYRDELLKQYNI